VDTEQRLEYSATASSIIYQCTDLITSGSLLRRVTVPLRRRRRAAATSQSLRNRRVGYQLIEAQFADVDGSSFRFQSDRQSLWMIFGRHAGLQHQQQQQPVIICKLQLPVITI